MASLSTPSLLREASGSMVSFYDLSKLFSRRIFDHLFFARPVHETEASPMANLDLTSFLRLQPSKIRPFSSTLEKRAIWVPGLPEYLAKLHGAQINPHLGWQTSRKHGINHISRRPSWWVGRYRPQSGDQKRAAQFQQRGIFQLWQIWCKFATFPHTFQNNLVRLNSIALTLPKGPLAHTENGLKFYIFSQRTKQTRGYLNYFSRYTLEVQNH